MTKHPHITIHIQLADGRQLDSGIHEWGNSVTGVSHGIALMVLAQNETGLDQSVALKAVEILIDDMQTNLPGNGAQLCLQESIDNVNEYLLQLQNGGLFSAVDALTCLAAIQYEDARIYSVMTGNFTCLLVHAGVLVELGGKISRRSRLGENSGFDPRIQDHKVQQGDLLLMACSKDIELIGQDYARVTLLRFGNNLDVALRQINQKASHRGAKQPPALIIARINNTAAASSWMKILRKP